MLSSKNYFTTLMIVILVVGIFRTTMADSVYVINDTDTEQIQAYEIDGYDLIYQKSYNCREKEVIGAVGLAIDNSPDGQYLFVTFESGSNIELVNAKTMEYVDTVVAPQGNNLAGVVLDQERSKLYVMKRATNYLYSYVWDRENEKLVLDLPYPYYVELKDCQQGFGLAYDEVNDRLFVGDSTTTVKYYDPNDWSKLGEFDVLHTAVGIAVDVENKYVYTGSSQFGNNDFLCRHALNPSDPCDVDIKVDVESPVLGIAVDQETSLVYVTTYGTGNPQTRDRLMVYTPFDPNNPEDPNTNILSLVWKSGDIGDPAGVAVVSGVGYKPPLIDITKVDDVDDPNGCVIPENLITYRICILPGADPNEYFDVTITDHLPDEVYFVSADPNNGEYDPIEHTYTWYEGYVPGYDPNEPGDPNICMTLTVRVSEAAEPMGVIKNIVEVESEKYYNTATEYTPVCCWEHDDAVTGVIYVDQRATGYNTGTCWDDAYLSLQSALDRAAKGCGDEIWVARGVYKPGSSAGSTFGLVDDVEVYGGFIGNETARDQRNFVRNKTYLSGNNVCSIVVTADNVSSATILDGFIIQEGTTNGVYCYYGDPAIANCVIMDNGGDGVYGNFSEPTFSDCVIKTNDGDGIEFYGSGCSPIIERTKIYDNADYGIYAFYTTPSANNNWIHHNDGGGIYLYYCSSAADIHNNTIAHNYNVGVKKYAGTAPTIVNCILWENQDDLDGCSATYSCIQDSDNGDGNIDSDPKFAYEDPNASYNYHLDPESPCIDAGNDSAVAQGETDIDGDDRIYDWPSATGTGVDMGADEVHCDDVSNEVDWNADGIVNLFEYADLANAWLSIDPEYTTDPNEAINWNPLCDLNDDHYIDMIDLAYLCDQWLWKACWLNTDTWMMMSMGQGGGVGRAIATEPLSEAEIEAAKFRKWRIHRPMYWPNLQEEAWMLEDIVRWLTDIWYQHEEIRKEFDEKDYFDFVERLKDMWKEKVNLLLSSYKEKT